MVKRAQRHTKFSTWCIYFPNKPQLRTWKRILREVVESGRAKLKFREVSNCRVEVDWLRPVTCDSAARLVRLARQQNSSFEILGDPTGIDDDVDMAAHEAAPFPNPADEAASAPTPANEAASAPTPAMVVSGLSTRSASDSHGVPKDDEPDAAAEPAQTLPLLPSPVLSLKSEQICLRLPHHKYDFADDCNNYQVLWEKSLGNGSFGTIYEGIARGLANQPVAIKIFRGGSSRSLAARNADAEVRRYVALPSHPHVLKLLDVGLFERLNQPPAIGLVFERFDTNVSQFLNRGPLKVAGMRHVLRSVLAALAYMHELGLVHADLKPANILLRGAGAFKDSWRRLFGNELGLALGGGAESASGAASANGGADVEESLQLTYHLPASFEVLSFQKKFDQYRSYLLSGKTMFRTYRSNLLSGRYCFEHIVRIFCRET